MRPASQRQGPQRIVDLRVKLHRSQRQFFLLPGLPPVLCPRQHWGARKFPSWWRDRAAQDVFFFLIKYFYFILKYSWVTVTVLPSLWYSWGVQQSTQLYVPMCLFFSIIFPFLLGDLYFNSVVKFLYIFWMSPLLDICIADVLSCFLWLMMTQSAEVFCLFVFCWWCVM